jgi:hypothetical protein
LEGIARALVDIEVKYDDDADVGDGDGVALVGSEMRMRVVGGWRKTWMLSRGGTF